MANENNFLTASQSLVIKHKTVAKQAFNYKGFADLKNLIDFVGNTPKIDIQNGQPVLTFKKKVVKDNTIILRNSFGEVISVLTYAEANELYDIAAQRDFKPEDKNKLQTKEVTKKVVKK